MSQAFASFDSDYQRYVHRRDQISGIEALPMAAAQRDGLLPDGLCGCSSTCPCLSCTCPCVTCGVNADGQADA